MLGVKGSTQITQPSGGGAYCDTAQLMALRWQAQHLTLPKARRVSRPQSGMHRSRFRGRGMEFSEVRVYQPGDDVRSIDWRVTARRQTPHTRLYNEERERPVMILCDQSHSQFFGSRRAFKSVRAAEAAALFAWTALAHNDRVGGIVFGDQGHHETRPARSRKNLLRFLQSISVFNNALGKPGDRFENNAHGQNFKEVLTETLRVVKPGTLIVLISDFIHLDNDNEMLISRLSQHNELLLIETCDELEQQMPPPGRYPVSQGEHTLLWDTRHKYARERYREWIQLRQERLNKMALKYRCPRVRLDTSDDPATALQSMLLSVGR